MAELLVPIENPDVESFASICARILSADDVDSSRKIAWESLSPLMLYNARYSVSEQVMNKLECVRTYVGMVLNGLSSVHFKVTRHADQQLFVFFKCFVFSAF